MDTPTLIATCLLLTRSRDLTSYMEVRSVGGHTRLSAWRCTLTPKRVAKSRSLSRLPCLGSSLPCLGSSDGFRTCPSIGGHPILSGNLAYTSMHVTGLSRMFEPVVVMVGMVATCIVRIEGTTDLSPQAAQRLSCSTCKDAHHKASHRSVCSV